MQIKPIGGLGCGAARFWRRLVTGFGKISVKSVRSSCELRCYTEIGQKARSTGKLKPRNRSELRDVCAKRNQMGQGQGLAVQQPCDRGICYLV